MRIRRVLCRGAALAGVLIGTVVGAGDAFAQGPPGAQPAAAPAPKAAEPAGKTLPEISLNDVGLPDIIAFLRDVDPGFQAVIAYAPGIPRGEPKIQELRLKNVTTDAVLHLLAETYPQINIEAVSAGGEDGKGRIWTIRVGRDPRVDERDMALAPVTTVNRLREIVDSVSDNARGAAERKRAMDLVLSLVQAAVETAGRDGPPAVVKLHEGTETLVFKGTPEQVNLVQQTLASLEPPKDERDAKAQQQMEAYKREIQAQQMRVEGVRQELELTRKQNEMLRQDVARMQDAGKSGPPGASPQQPKPEQAPPPPQPAQPK
jgi:hypothetical protein